MNKIKAFSILELIVVMLISMIVMGIAYQGYLLFHKQFLSFKKNADKIADLSLMDRLLHSDISDSRIVLKNSKGIDCIYPDKTIIYEWEDTYALRKDAGLIDTFHLTALEGITFTFLSKPANTFEMVDELVFIDKTKESQKVFHYLKKYGADIIINNPNRADHGRN